MQIEQLARDVFDQYRRIRLTRQRDVLGARNGPDGRGNFEASDGCISL
ncbi:hypothetical protein [Nocardia sp. NPDC004711]